MSYSSLNMNEKIIKGLREIYQKYDTFFALSRVNLNPTGERKFLLAIGVALPVVYVAISSRRSPLII